MPSLTGAAGGAATGASIGSFVPGIGTGIGAGIGALIGLFKKKKPATDATAATTAATAPTTALPDEATKLLQQQSTTQAGKAGALEDSSSQALAPVLQYFKSLIGGDPAALLSATAPERGRVIDQYDTARRSAANFAPRGGGSSTAIANSYNDEAQQLGDITSTARRSAITDASQLGVQLQSLGLSHEQLQTADLNTIIQAVLSNKGLDLTKQGLDLTKRGQNLGAITGIGEAAGQLLGAWLGRDKTT